MNAPNAGPPVPFFQPYGLVSLWDIMTGLKADAILRGVVVLSDMNKKWLMEGVGRQPFVPHQFEYVLQRVRELREALEDSDLLISAGHAKGLADALDMATTNTDGLRVVEGESFSYATHHLDCILKVVSNEAATKLFLPISSRMAEAFDRTKPLWGQEVSAKFSSISYEIEEAGKCLALDRSTAAAFHSIRILEATIRALSRCLQIPDPTKASQRSWMKMLDSLKGGIGRKWPTNNDRMSGDGEFFDNAYAALAAMQNPWRNATMHLDQKYTSDEARHIFETVRGFTIKLASRMDEDGLPFA